MNLQLATLVINDYDDEEFSVRATVDIVVPQGMKATGNIELVLNLDRETFGEMTFNELSELAKKQALAAIAASK